MTPDRRRLLRAVALAYAVALAGALATAAALAGRHPLLVAAVADLVATVAVFAASVRYDNASLYDPYWSVAPIPIAAGWLAVGAGAPAPRAWLAAGLLLLWAVRLTANCLVRWRSLSDEDFRYVELRRRSGRAWWPVSFLAVHLFPSVWVFLGLLPLFPVLALPSRPLGWLDGVAGAVTAGALLVEGLADLQLRRFLANRTDRAAVLETGLWSFSRHPNYLGEVLFWWGLWLFGLAADPGWWRTVAGPLAITALFAFVSAPWMDRRMEAHHPGWRARRAGVPALLPLPGARGDPRPPID